MIPITLCANGLTIVIAGGGATAKQKAQTFFQSNVFLRVIDPVTKAWEGVEWIAEPYQSSHLQGAGLVIAAATPAVNACVVQDAREARILVCNSSDPSTGDFVLPSVLRRGELQIAISTGGASPTLSRRIRQRLELQFEPQYDGWISLLKQIRTVVRANIPEMARRRILLEEFAQDSWLERLKQVGSEAVWQEMLTAVEVAQQQL